jgi:endonuclease-3 related protein
LEKSLQPGIEMLDCFSMKKKLSLRKIYSRLYARFGPQGWWPGKTPFEISVGAILTQNTNWANVEKAVANLKAARVLSPRKLYALTERQLAELIRPSGYYNVKARRLRAFLSLLCEKYGASLKRMFRLPLEELRQELLSVNGIGEETADSIILYAAEKPTFVIDAYTRRILSRHGFCEPKATYAEIKMIFESALKPDVQLYNEFHALFVRLGKTLCRPRNPFCNQCPLDNPLFAR